jgi:hypothetical protein
MKSVGWVILISFRMNGLLRMSNFVKSRRVKRAFVGSFHMAALSVLSSIS